MVLVLILKVDIEVDYMKNFHIIKKLEVELFYIMLKKSKSGYLIYINKNVNLPYNQSFLKKSPIISLITIAV